jgi:hypothetical protein
LRHPLQSGRRSSSNQSDQPKLFRRFDNFVEMAENVIHPEGGLPAAEPLIESFHGQLYPSAASRVEGSPPRFLPPAGAPTGSSDSWDNQPPGGWSMNIVSLMRSGWLQTLLASSQSKSIVAVSLLVHLVAATAGGEMRSWSSASGNYQAEAELQQLHEDGTVVLKKKDGAVVKVPLSKLSLADQEYLRKHANINASTDTRSTTPPAETPKSIADVEQEAQQCRTAKQAVLVYSFYLAKPHLSAQQRAAAEASLESWKKKADDGLVRLGNEWMKQAEADAIRKQADAKIE